MNEEMVATTPEQEVANVQSEVTPEAKPAAEPEVTVSEALETEPKPAETVGLDKFLAEKQGRKNAERELKELKAAHENAATSAEKQEVSDDVESFLAEYPDVDSGFVNKLLGIAESRASKKAAEAIKPITEKDKAEKINTAFNSHFAKAMDAMPEYKDIANPEVIKSLSLLPQNAKKTFAQIIEETYANAIGGKRTLETTTPRGGNEPESVDMDRMNRDAAYFDEVMSNPQMKKEYNAGMMSHIRL